MSKRKQQHHQYADVNPDLIPYLSDDEEAGQDGAETIAQQQPWDLVQQSEVVKTVLIGNLPLASADKIEKLREKLQAIITSKIGEDVNMPPQVYIPVDRDTGASKGMGFAYLDSEESARICVSALDEYKFGKNVLRFYHYAQLTEDVPAASSVASATPKTERENAKAMDEANSWLLDGREQYAIRFADQTQIKWCDNLAFDAEAEHVYGGERESKAWCRKNIAWSPQGRYLLTFHEPGLMLWAGPDFQRVGRFAHARFTHAEVSPCERYVVTYEELAPYTTTQKENLLVWNIKTGTLKRSFHVSGEDLVWPIFKWSHDGQYVARQIENGISVYDSSSMTLLEGKPVPCKGVESFEWSPSEHRVAFFAPEEGNVPARICIMDPVKRVEVRSKIVFSVNACKLFWQDAGDFLCAQVTRTKKKTVFTSFEFFRLRDSGVPNETMNVNETVGSFVFEQSGGVRFAVVHTALPEAEIQQKMNISFYTLGAARKGSEIALVHKLENRACNTVLFAPHQLGVCVVASLEQFTVGSGTGALEFFDLDSKQSLAQTDHYNCSQIEWDSSGRFLASVCRQPSFGGNVLVRYTVDNGYRIWSFQGQRLQDVALHDFYQFLWRPRRLANAPQVLTEEEMEDVRKKLANTMRKMDKEDGLLRKRRAAATNAARIIELEAFRSVLAERTAAALARRQAKGLATVTASAGKQEELEEIVEKVEELISEKTELYVPSGLNAED